MEPVNIRSDEWATATPVAGLRSIPWALFDEYVAKQAPVWLLKRAGHRHAVETLVGKKMGTVKGLHHAVDKLTQKEQKVVKKAILGTKRGGARRPLGDTLREYLDNGVWLPESVKSDNIPLSVLRQVRRDRDRYEKFGDVVGALNDLEEVQHCYDLAREVTDAWCVANAYEVSLPKDLRENYAAFLRSWMSCLYNDHRTDEYQSALQRFLLCGRGLIRRLRCVATTDSLRGVNDTLRAIHSRTTQHNARSRISITIKREDDGPVDVLLRGDGGVLEWRSVFLPTLTLTYHRGSKCVSVYRKLPGVERDVRQVDTVPCAVIDATGFARMTEQGREILDFLSLWNADAVHTAQQIGKFTGYCLDCGSQLSTKESLERGMGPDCFAKTWLRGTGYVTEGSVNVCNVVMQPAKGVEPTPAPSTRTVTIMATEEEVQLEESFVRSLAFFKNGETMLLMESATKDRLLELQRIFGGKGREWSQWRWSHRRWRAFLGVPPANVPALLELADQLGANEFFRKALAQGIIDVLSLQCNQDIRECLRR